ncbi:MAG TPA: DUF4339 domain-containing protein [Humisphaera sp.]
MLTTLTTPDPATTSAADPTGPRWYYRIHGLERGPVTWDALQDLACDGTLKPSDLVRYGEDGRWVVASRARAEEPPSPPPRPNRADPPPGDRLAAVLAAGVGVPAAVVSAPSAEPTSPAPMPPAQPPVAADEPLVAQGKTTVAPSSAGPADPAPRSNESSAAGPAVLALALALVGVFVYALPLGMVSTYLGARAAVAARRAGSGGTASFAAVALLVGLTDVGLALWAIGAKLAAMRG